MVTIITGKINAGKTSFLLRHYLQHQQGDGFLAIKRMEGEKIYGFDLLRLANQKKLSWMIHQNYYQQNFAEAARFGPYYLNLETLREVEATIEMLIDQKVEIVYLDEIGVLELNGGGYHNLLVKLLKSGVDLVMSAREDLVKPIIQHFAIADYELTQVQREE